MHCLIGYCLLRFVCCNFLTLYIWTKKRSFWKTDLTVLSSPFIWSTNTHMFCVSYQCVKPHSYILRFISFLPELISVFFFATVWNQVCCFKCWVATKFSSPYSWGLILYLFILQLIVVMLLGYRLAYHFENDSIVFSDGFYDSKITQKFFNVAGFVIRNSMLGFLIIW